MASKNFRGTLLDPDGSFSAGDRVRFTHKTTTGNTLSGAVKEIIIPQDGVYNIDLEYGLILIEYRPKESNYRAMAIVTINNDTVVTTLTGLIGTVTPITDEQLLMFQAIQADVQRLRDETENVARIVGTGNYEAMLNKVPMVKSGGAMDVASIIDFHAPNSEADFNLRITATSNGGAIATTSDPDANFLFNGRNVGVGNIGNGFDIYDNGRITQWGAITLTTIADQSDYEFPLKVALTSIVDAQIVAVQGSSPNAISQETRVFVTSITEPDKFKVTVQPTPTVSGRGMRLNWICKGR